MSMLLSPSMSMAWFVLLLLALYVASLFGKGRFAAFTPDKTQPLRGILAVLIVAHHLSHIAPADAVLTPVYSWSASLVSLFFFISGFGLTRQLASRGQSYLSGFFARRIVRGILVSWLLAYVLFLLLGGNQAWNPADAVLGLLATGNTTLPYSWYVLCILYLYVGFYLCARFVPGRWMAPALAVWTLAGMTAVGLAGWERCWYLSALAFPAGAFYARHEASLLAFFRRRPWSYRLAVPVLLLVAGAFFLLKKEWANAAFFALLPLMVAVPLMRVGTERLSAWRPLAWLSRKSYEIYLCQGIAFMLTHRFLPSGVGAWPYLLTAFVLTFLLAGAVHWASHRLSSALLKK